MVIGPLGVVGQIVLFLVEGTHTQELDHVQTQSRSMVGMNVKEITLKHRFVILNIVLVSFVYSLDTCSYLIKVKTWLSVLSINDSVV